MTLTTCLVPTHRSARRISRVTRRHTTSPLSNSNKAACPDGLLTASFYTASGGGGQGGRPTGPKGGVRGGEEGGSGCKALPSGQNIWVVRQSGSYFRQSASTWSQADWPWILHPSRRVPTRKARLCTTLRTSRLMRPLQDSEPGSLADWPGRTHVGPIRPPGAPGGKAGSGGLAWPHSPGDQNLANTDRFIRVRGSIRPRGRARRERAGRRA